MDGLISRGRVSITRVKFRVSSIHTHVHLGCTEEELFAQDSHNMSKLDTICQILALATLNNRRNSPKTADKSSFESINVRIYTVGKASVVKAITALPLKIFQIKVVVTEIQTGNPLNSSLST